MAPLTLRTAIASAVVLITAGTLPPAAALPDLRIMPLGDSITKGSLSTHGNGYRKRLRDKIIDREHVSVNMIGSLRSGEMTDNNHEGHSGKFLGDIEEYWKLSIGKHPNVVLLMGGTNNMDLEIDLDGCPAIMENIIDGLFDKAPDAVVLVAPIIWANDARMQKHTDRFNEKLNDIIDTRQKASKHLLSVPIDIGITDLADKKHPDDGGYDKMAEAWLKSILEADKRGWLKAPFDFNGDYDDNGDGNGDDNGSDGNSLSKPAHWFLMVGMPFIGTLLIVS